MRLAIVSDVFPPLRSSGAVQLRDLSVEFARQGHEVTMMVASPDLDAPYKVEAWCGVRIARLKSARTKDTSYVRRAIGEFLMPFAMLRNLHKSPLRAERWDGVIWYSPTIFLGPFVNALKRSSGCRSYLIIRDIFPEWAVDMGLMRRGLPYWFFKSIANHQYAAADVVGIQTSGNRVYFREWVKRAGRQLEVLQNWLADRPVTACSISVTATSLSGRKILVYAGNMGIAQGMGILLDLAERLKQRTDIGFLFVGRGSDAQRLRSDSVARKLNNVVFFDEIDPDEIPALYSQCHVGLVALDPRHQTHNVPGKFLSYMQSGLPVLASINPGNDLVKLILEERVGQVCDNASVELLATRALALVDELTQDNGYTARCKSLSERMFTPKAAVNQIVSALQCK
jgi:glycosyltransferase involved in cell wall biosynthesis